MASRKGHRYDVFLSYSSRDADWVCGKLLPALEGARLKVCIDSRDFVAGAPLATEMERAAVDSRHTVVVLSPDYLKSGWTEFENLLVQTRDPAARQRAIVPIRIAPCDVPPRLEMLTRVDFVPPADESHAFEHLIGALRKRPAARGKKTAATAPRSAAAPSAPAPLSVPPLGPPFSTTSDLATALFGTLSPWIVNLAGKPPVRTGVPESIAGLWDACVRDRAASQRFRAAVALWKDDPSDADHGTLLRTELTALFDASRSLTAEVRASLTRLREPQSSSAPSTTYHAVVKGSGVIAQGKGAIAAGPGAVVIGGSAQVHGGVHVNHPPSDEATRAADDAIAAYRVWIARQHAGLPLRGIDLGASDATSADKPLRLASVYVDLATTSRDELAPSKRKNRRSRTATPDELAGPEHGAPPLSALAALARNPRVVLLGGPGSGKSTLMGYVAMSLASGQAPSPDEPRRKKASSATTPLAPDLIPIPIVLRDVAAALPESITSGNPKVIWDFLAARLAEQSLSSALAPIQAAAQAGHGILLFDGLDEVSGERQRKVIVESVRAFAERYPASRVVVTCRTLSYQDPRWRLAGFESFEIAPFDDERIDRFIRAWYAELAAVGTVREIEAASLAQRLSTAIRRPDLWRLAPSPLLLTVMALVHTHRGRLPDARALLYEETVDLLLWRWEQLKQRDGEGPSLRRLMNDVNVNDMDFKRALWRLAFEVHGASAGPSDDGVADVGEHALEVALAALHPRRDKGWADAVIDSIKHRAGLLLERSQGVYAFPHRTFQEYLAGAHLSTLGDFGRAAAGHTRELDRWREVVLLAVGRLVHVAGDTDKPLALVGELCPASTGIDALAWRRAWFAGEVLLEIGVRRAAEGALGADLLERTRHRLVELLRQSPLTARERAEAGAVLAQLGDPRLEVIAVDHMAFCDVPAGPFRMGSADGDGRAWSDERPAHEVTLAGFSIARWPVTGAQYAAFVDSGGYTDERWWTEAQRNGVWKAGKIKGRYEDEPTTGPLELPVAFTAPNQPVAGVSWYEALAFTRWLTERWRDSSRIRRDQTVMLPSEAEWEKAARGGLVLPNGQPNAYPAYPWGDAFDSSRANIDETGIGRPSAVGCFPGGVSPYGVEEMIGNVWEWTRSQTESYPYRADDEREKLDAGAESRRVVRGGAYFYDPRYARSAARLDLNPDYRIDSIGFRVIVSPP
ncbi:MAG: SUMF1/EgtB/PvdO family nonheme iron enzyme [bacterium]